MAFSGNTQIALSALSGAQVRIQVPHRRDPAIQKEIETNWAKAKDYAHSSLWLGMVLPGLLQGQGIDTSEMDIDLMLEKLGELWSDQQANLSRKFSVVMNFTIEDYLMNGYDGVIPTYFDKEKMESRPIKFNAAATIGSNDFRWFIMNTGCVPDDCFFGTYPVKSKDGVIEPGAWNIVLKTKK